MPSRVSTQSPPARSHAGLRTAPPGETRKRRPLTPGGAWGRLGADSAKTPIGRVRDTEAFDQGRAEHPACRIPRDCRGRTDGGDGREHPARGDLRQRRRHSVRVRRRDAHPPVLLGRLRGDEPSRREHRGLLHVHRPSAWQAAGCRRGLRRRPRVRRPHVRARRGVRLLHFARPRWTRHGGAMVAARPRRHRDRRLPRLSLRRSLGPGARHTHGA